MSHLHVVSITETVSLSDSSLNIAVSMTSYSVDGLRPVRMYLLSLPLRTTYTGGTHKALVLDYRGLPTLSSLQKKQLLKDVG